MTVTMQAPTYQQIAECQPFRMARCCDSCGRKFGRGEHWQSGRVYEGARGNSRFFDYDLCLDCVAEMTDEND